LIDRHENNDALKGQRGVALIMVLVVITILTVVTVEFQYESRVYLRLAGNARDEMRAHYLANSAMAFTQLILYFQTTVDQMIAKFWKNNPPNIQLWQLIPIDSDLARAVAGGMFSMQEQQSLFDDTTIGGMNEENQEEVNEQAAGLTFGEAEGFGSFEGHFQATVEDEERKINLNIRPGNSAEKEGMKKALLSLIEPVQYDILFENPDKYGQYHDRNEIINAIVDWIDPDNIMEGFDSGDEASRYEYLEEPYPSRNHFFDTLDEVQLVSGIDDRFWNFFSDSLTIYRTKKININTCNPEVMRSLLYQYLAEPLPQEAEMTTIIDKIMAFRLESGGFWNEDGFINYITLGPDLILEIKGDTNGKRALRNAITVKSEMFTIKAEGDINGVYRHIKIVMKKDGTLLYYREE